MNKFLVTRVYGDKNGEATLNNLPAEKSVVILALPIEPVDQYKSNMMQALTKAYADMTTGLTFTADSFGSSVSEEGYEFEFVHLLKSLGVAISYLHNSQSGRDKKLHEFDKQELYNKFSKFINHLK